MHPDPHGQIVISTALAMRGALPLNVHYRDTGI